MSMDLSALLTFNTVVALLGTSALGLACGMTGSFTVLRQRALIGDCVAHASLPGVCIAFMLFHERAFHILFVGAIISGLLSAWLVTTIHNLTRIKEDAALALVLSTFFGLGITLSRIIQNTPKGAQAGLESFILGKAATITAHDAFLTGLVALVAIGVIGCFFKEFVLLCFDREFAISQGFPIFLIDTTLMTLVCLCAAAGLPAVGAVLVVALLIFPPVTARLWCDNVRSMVILSAFFGALSCALGTAASALIEVPFASDGLPTGPLIVLANTALFGTSFLAHTIGRLRIKVQQRGTNT